jgi:hypothetical protein
MPERLDHVEVATPKGPIMLKWDVRDQLIRKLQDHPLLDPVVRDFENAGATRPVKIPAELNARVIVVIDNWMAGLPEGRRGLPPGVWKLRNGLVGGA